MTGVEGRLVGIYHAPAAGEPMVSLVGVAVQEGKGLYDDRYAKGIGYWQENGSIRRRQGIVRHISLIASEAFLIANERTGVPGLWTPRIARRNLAIDDIDPYELNSLVGKEFTVGDLTLRGTEKCNPHTRPGRLADISEGFMQAFQGIGGLRAQVINGAVISLGDLLRV